MLFSEEVILVEAQDADARAVIDDRSRVIKAWKIGN